MPVKIGSRAYRSPRRAATAELTRARIVAAALALLGGGKNAAPFSLDAVARQAGVTRLTVYNQFESKRGLLEAVFDDVAQRGGLSELAEVFAESNAAEALRRFVSVFCRFWMTHRGVMPKFSAITKLDDEIAASVTQRSERRRQALTVLVRRLRPGAGHAGADLVDVLFALTSFEMFEALSVRNRTAKSVETIIHALAEQAVSRLGGAA